MMNRTHALSGAALYLTAYTAAGGTGLTQAAVGAVCAAGAATLPDLDHPNSSPARVFGPATRGLAWLLGKAAGGHRNGTHSLLGLAVFTAAAWTAGAYGGPVAVGITVALLTGMALAALTDQQLTLRALAAAAAGYAVARYIPQAVDGWMLPLAVGLGSVAHVTGDCLTDQGCPLAWPASQRTAQLPLVDTDGLREKLIVAPAMAGLTVYAALALTGLWSPLVTLLHQR